MPTTRPRHQITETPEVEHALERERREADRGRLAAVDASSGKYADAFGEDYLAELRQEWHE